MNKHIALLEEYLPAGVASLIWDRVEKDNVRFRISKPRKSKLGDYRPPFGNKGHRISVNADLNPYSFLITVLHEFAHLETWNRFKNTRKPHGKEWKEDFKALLVPFLKEDVFPETIEKALEQYLINPAASSCVDISLMRALAKFDAHPQLFVESLPEGSRFKLSNGLVFEKGVKLRKRYRCKCISNNRWYFVSATATVEQISIQQRLF
ncbi:MAG: SprT protein [bacterium]